MSQPIAGTVGTHDTLTFDIGVDQGSGAFALRGGFSLN
jgi:hypothetical protein